MTFAWQMLANTPPWVWALLALLLYLGIRALRPSTAPLWRISVLPTIFFLWGLYGLYAMHAFTAQRISPWVAALAAGTLIGIGIAGLHPIRADKARNLIHLPGSALTLVLGLAIFAARYAFGVLHAVAPAHFAEPQFWLTELAVSGVLTGMFMGRFAGLWRQYRAAPPVNCAEHLP